MSSATEIAALEEIEPTRQKFIKIHNEEMWVRFQFLFCEYTPQSAPQLNFQAQL